MLRALTLGTALMAAVFVLPGPASAGGYRDKDYSMRDRDRDDYGTRYRDHDRDRDDWRRGGHWDRGNHYGWRHGHHYGWDDHGKRHDRDWDDWKHRDRDRDRDHDRD